MITFIDAQKIWASRRPHNGSVHLSSEFRGSSVCRLHKINDEAYAVSRHGHRIVWIHPDHYVVDMQGWEAAPSTRHTVQEVTGAWVGSARPGSEVSTSIGGHPYFAGIRLHTNGVVVEEDRRPWKRRFISKEGQRTWRELMKWLRTAAEARVNIGEFADKWKLFAPAAARDLLHIQREWLGRPQQDATHEVLAPLFRGCKTWEEATAHLRRMRASFYALINAYEYRETK